MSANANPVPTRDDILRMAKSYLTRRAASTQQLRRVLLRKVRLRLGQHRDPDVDVTAIIGLVDEVVERVARAGLLDDAALAVSRAIGFAAQGLPATRVRDKLKQQGLDASVTAVDERIEHDDEAQARRYAERKRLGPYGSGRRAVSAERDLRSMVRAGFSPRLAARILGDLSREAEAFEDEGDAPPRFGRLNER